MAGLSKKLNLKFEFFKTKKLRFLHSLIWQVFFQHCFTKQSKKMLKKLVKWENDEISIFFVLKNSNFEFSFLDNLAISGPGKCKIRNLCIKMSKTPKYGLWEMMGSFYWCFQDISMKLTWSYWALWWVRIFTKIWNFFAGLAIYFKPYVWLVVAL